MSRSYKRYGTGTRDIKVHNMPRNFGACDFCGGGPCRSTTIRSKGKTRHRPTVGQKKKKNREKDVN